MSTVTAASPAKSAIETEAKPKGEASPPVEKVVIVKIKATNDQIVTYVNRVKEGLPTGKIFGAPMSDVEFTEFQRGQISAARKEHKANCKRDKKRILSIVSRKAYDLVGYRRNAKEEKDITRASLRFEKTVL